MEWWKKKKRIQSLQQQKDSTGYAYYDSNSIGDVEVLWCSSAAISKMGPFFLHCESCKEASEWGWSGKYWRFGRRPNIFPIQRRAPGTAQQTVSCRTSAKYVPPVPEDASHHGLGGFVSLPCAEWFPDSPQMLPKRKNGILLVLLLWGGNLVLSIKLYIYSSPSLTPLQNVLQTKAKFAF